MLRALNCIVISTIAALAQVNGPAAFDVAAVKSAAPDQHKWGWGAEAGGVFHADNLTLKQLVAVAYGVQDFQVSGGDGWVTDDHWDIRAKAETDAKLSNDLVRPPLRALLAARFALKARMEKRPETSYSIAVAKDGPKMKLATENSRSASIAAGRVNGKRISMERLAQMLSILLERPVVDKTGLAGEYEVSLEWTPETGEGTQMFGPVHDTEFRRGGSIFTAIQEQLGLRLDAVKQLVDVVVIESAARASAN